MLGLDQDVIARGIEMKYKELGEKTDGEGIGQFTIQGMRYLEKIIQLPFQIPPIEQVDMNEFVEDLSTDWPHEECPKVFSIGLANNPRQIKRTVNVFFMLWNLSKKRQKKLQGFIKPIRLAKVVAIQTVFPDFYNLFLKDNPQYLRELEEHYRREFSEEKTPQKSDTSKTDIQKERIQPLPVLIDSWSKSNAIAVRRILTMHPLGTNEANFVDLSDSELDLYFTLTRRVETFHAQPSGRHSLSDREMEVLSLIVRGMSNKEISSLLGISHQTVKNHDRLLCIKNSKFDTGGLSL